MEIRSLSLTNFRRFREFEISLDRRLTVVVAKNGEGKTSVLDGIAVALGTFVGAFDMGTARHINRTDARHQRGQPDTEQQFPVAVKAKLSLPNHQRNQGMQIKRELSSLKSKTTIKDAWLLTDYGRSLMEQVRDSADVTLPVVSYYGSGRLWMAHKNTSRKRVLSESRTLGYEDCLTSASNFKQLQQWMGKATLAAMQQQQMPDYKGYKLNDQVEGIKQAVGKVLSAEGWKDFHYSLTHEELAMRRKTLGLLPVSLLSDGVRAMASLAADLAWRCAKLNPHLGKDASRQTPGIALIDEVDLHLHPAWQQRVIKSLVRAFPKMQFIVTTHSPQVLSTVKRESIRVISFDDRDNCSCDKPHAMSYGEESQNVLQAIMGVDPQPPVPEKDGLDKLTLLVEGGKYESSEAKKLFEQLKRKLPSEHPQLQRLERSVRRQEALGR